MAEAAADRDLETSAEHRSVAFHAGGSRSVSGRPVERGGQPFDQAAFDAQLSPVLHRELPGLRTAFDDEAMKPYLQAALLENASPTFTVASCESVQACYLPDGSCLRRYVVEIRNQARTGTQRHLVGARIFRDKVACAAYMHEKLALPAVMADRREELAVFTRTVALIEQLNAVVYAFPVDGELATMTDATDPEHMAGVLNETLRREREGTFRIVRCDVELVHYPSRHRAVLRYQVEGRYAGSERVERQTVYGKLFADGAGELSGEVAAALRKRVVGAKDIDPVNIPRTLGWRPELRICLLEAIPGESLIRLLRARLRGKAGTPGALPLEEMIEHCGRIAALLHTSDIELGPTRAFADDVAALREELAPVLRISPTLGRRLRRWMDQLGAYAERSDALPLCFSHGDFGPNQVVFDGATPGLLDFDSICRAEPALDLGQFLAYLHVTRNEKCAASQSCDLVEHLAARFVDAYVAALGDRIASADRLRARVSIYKVLSLLRRTMRGWQKFSIRRTESALAVLEHEIARLRQSD